MGILSSSSDVIIVDTVLTDLGRKLLARNDGSFKIVKYAFGDDEIDYTLSESNILNTPIFEASTNEDVALKSMLITISDPNLTTLPVLQMSNQTGTIKEAGDTNYQIVFKQNSLNGVNINAELVDDVFMVEVDNILLSLYYNNTLQSSTALTPLSIAQYTLIRDEDLTATNGGKLTIAINVKRLSDAVWATLGAGTVGSRTIITKVRCTGMQSGMSATFTLTINEVA